MAKRIRDALALMAVCLLLAGCNDDGKRNDVQVQRDAQYSQLATADARTAQ